MLVMNHWRLFYQQNYVGIVSAALDLPAEELHWKDFIPKV